jgi:hypothetical protein
VDRMPAMRNILRVFTFEQTSLNGCGIKIQKRVEIFDGAHGLKLDGQGARYAG